MHHIRSSTFNTSPLDRSSPFLHPQSPDLPPLYIVLSPSLHLLHTSQPASIFFSDLPFEPSNPYLLGVDKHHAYYCLHLSTQPSTLPPNATFSHLRPLSFTLPPDQAAIAAHARSLSEFHLRHLFCGLCGSATHPDRHGSRRRCSRNIKATEPVDVTQQQSNTTCTGIWFPRIDPVAIMLVVHPDNNSVLLGRQKRFPQGMYSCLAGFMEHAEGVEDTVRREVREESGIEVGTVRFFGSQAWPFPYSLMLGCIARATSTDICVDKNEIEEAKWFSRAQICEMVDNTSGKGLFVPPKSAIAGLLCRAFAEGEDITIFDSDMEASL